MTDRMGRMAIAHDPTGEYADVEFVSDPESEPLDLTGGKPTADGFKMITLDITALDLGTAHLLFGSRRVFGYPRPLAVNGHEYRRRVRRR